MGYIAVIDTETNWCDAVMSIGIALADEETFTLADTRYYILTPECSIGGMYESVMDLVPQKHTHRSTRADAMLNLNQWFQSKGVRQIFAYNACFDHKHLPELSHLVWYDIMRIAAYRQHNVHIPKDAPCCSTGRLKSHYGVEPILRLLTGDSTYSETHNALYDAVDELSIMRLLGLSLPRYENARLS